MGRLPLARASLSIHAKTLEPKFWTDYFGIAPDHSHRKGEHFLTPSGRLSTGVAWIGAWLFDTDSKVRSDLLDPHIAFLVDRFVLPRGDLPQILQDRSANMRLFCYWDNGSGNRVPHISQHLRDIVTLSGGTIEIDIHPYVEGANGTWVSQTG